MALGSSQFERNFEANWLFSSPAKLTFDNGQCYSYQSNCSLSEYDSLQDKSDSFADQIKVLSKDLELSVQDCVKTKEKLALAEADLAENNSRLSSVSSELSDNQAKVKGLEESRAAQEKSISKISADNRELVN